MANTFASGGAEIRELLGLIEQYEKNQKRRERAELIKIVITGLLLLVTAGYLAFLYVFLTGFDAKTVTAMAAASLEDRLPKYETILQEKLLENAPNIVNNLEQKLLNAPAQYRPQIESRIFAKTRESVRTIEGRFESQIHRNLRINLKTENGETPMTDSEMDALAEKCRADFKLDVRDLQKNIYPEFAAELKRINEYLIKLADNKNLTPEESVHRELVQATLAVIPNLKLIDTAPEDK